MNAELVACYLVIFEPIGKGRKAGLFVLSPAISICDTDTGKNPSFVDIKTTAVIAKNFEHRDPPIEIVVGLAGTGHPAKSSQLRKR